MTNLSDSNDQTLTVSQLNRRVKDLLEVHFPMVWVEGELSNLSKPASGHWYFTLKDESAQISCAMFKRRNSGVKFAPGVGDHLKIRARVSLYEGRGDYQLIVEHMEQAGFGLLQKRFDELKTKLLEKGLFDEAFKKPLPPFVRHLAIVTSASGAAVKDVLSVLERRFPNLPVTIIPTAVQGDEAAKQIIEAIETADRTPKFDTILVCRGGGSIEDLWAFNNEALAQAIFACNTPIISAVGHEVDFTIADFVADLRAPTPSAAAELLSPDGNLLLRQLRDIESQLARLILATIEKRLDRVHFLTKHIKHPSSKIEQWQQRLDNCELRLARSMEKVVNSRSSAITSYANRLQLCSPQYLIAQKRERLSMLYQKTKTHMQITLESYRALLVNLLTQLDIMSPIATIRRGYSIAKTAQNDIVRSISQVKKGEKISLMTNDGNIYTSVDSTEINPKKVEQRVDKAST